MRSLPPPITSRTNARVKALRQAFSGKASQAGELTALEGEHLLAEATRAGVMLETLFIREGKEALLEQPSLRGLKSREVVVLSGDVFDSVMDTATPQGIAATLAIPVGTTAGGGLRAGATLLMLENVQDPGNVGTLIRSAAAFGASQVFLIGACANPWSPKALRASSGSVFSIPISKASLVEAVEYAHHGDRRVLAAVPSGESAVLAMDAKLSNGALLIGNEGQGLSAEALALADERVTIPCLIESFNAAIAGSILLYEAERQRVESDRKPGPPTVREELRAMAEVGEEFA